MTALPFLMTAGGSPALTMSDNVAYWHKADIEQRRG
jgi:hypothetical protein